jgi:Mn-dependent DtxR family transcriptional regulator
MNSQKLTTDEYDALEHISKGARHDRVNACVGRNAKKLAGLKLIEYARDGKVALTEKGAQLLFVRRCIVGLRALALDPATALDHDVAQFLDRKGHIATADGKYALTDKGRESLADIAAQELRQ